MNACLMDRRKKRATKNFFDKAKTRLGRSPPAGRDINLLEMQETLRMEFADLPAYLPKHSDLSLCSDGVVAASWSDTELVRNNLSRRERSLGHMEIRSASEFFLGILIAEQRAQAESLYLMGGFASELSCPVPGQEVPRAAPVP